jgi:hypothetical protein
MMSSSNAGWRVCMQHTHHSTFKQARLSSSKGLGLSFEQHLLIDFDCLAMVVLLMSTVALQYWCFLTGTATYVYVWHITWQEVNASESDDFLQEYIQFDQWYFCSVRRLCSQVNCRERYKSEWMELCSSLYCQHSGVHSVTFFWKVVWGFCSQSHIFRVLFCFLCLGPFLCVLSFLLWSSLWLVEDVLTSLCLFLIVRMEISWFLWEIYQSHIFLSIPIWEINNISN